MKCSNYVNVAVKLLVATCPHCMSVFTAQMLSRQIGRWGVTPNSARIQIKQIIYITVRATGNYSVTVYCVLTLSPLSSHNMGSPDPELPDTTLFLTVFCRNFQANISALRQ